MFGMEEDAKMTTVIECARLFDGHDIIKDSIVVIEGDRIAAVHIKDGGFTCRFLMLGLIDRTLNIAC